MNIARLFTAYRLLEDDVARLREKVEELERQHIRDVNYILSLRGAPPLVKPTEQPKAPVVMIPHKSLRQQRREKMGLGAVKEGLGREERAREYAERLNGGS